MRLLAGQIGKVNVTQRGKISTNATNVNILFFQHKCIFGHSQWKNGAKNDCEDDDWVEGGASW